MPKKVNVNTFFTLFLNKIAKDKNELMLITITGKNNRWEKVARISFTPTFGRGNGNKILKLIKATEYIVKKYKKNNFLMN